MKTWVDKLRAKPGWVLDVEINTEELRLEAERYQLETMKQVRAERTEFGTEAEVIKERDGHGRVRAILGGYPFEALILDEPHHDCIRHGYVRELTVLDKKRHPSTLLEPMSCCFYYIDGEVEDTAPRGLIPAILDWCERHAGVGQ